MNDPSTTDFHEEASSLRQGCGVVVRSGADRLFLRGEDRGRFLNGQMTCEVLALNPGEGGYGFFTSIKGRIEADATVLARQEELVLLLPPGLGPRIRKRLESYIIVDRVELAEPGPAERLTFIGRRAPALLEEVVGSSPPREDFEHRDLEIGGVRALLVKEGRLGSDAWSLWLPPDAARGLLERVEEVGRSDPGIQQVREDVYEAFRIEMGVARFGRDFGPENLPQETGIETAVSYTKGCYLGQEVVARLHYRGQVSRQLRRFEIPGPVPSSQPAELLLEGRAAGAVTSAAPAFGGDGSLGIGWVQRRAFETGTVLELATGGTAVVRALPDEEI